MQPAYVKAVAMEVYAYQAKDKELVTWSTELRKRAERRIGELIAELREAGKRATAGWQENWVRDGLPTLADEGIDKHLADRARKAAAMPAEKFEAHVGRRWRSPLPTLRGRAR
jgi:hypothetical protein